MLEDGLGPGWKLWRRRRYVVAFLAFLGFFNVYALRVNLSVAIVAMTTETNVTLENGTTIVTKDFDWSAQTQGALLSAFFYGYIATQFVGGWMAACVGGNKVYGVGVAATSFLTLLTPAAANVSIVLLFMVRVIEGLFEGVTYPCIHAVWSKWAPPLERSRLAVLAFSGSYVGTVVSMPVCGILAHQVGWPYIFYVFGTVGLLWCVLWWAVVKESPELDPHISPEELRYIQESIGPSSADDKKFCKPWCSFLTSLPVWSIVVAHFCENWGFYTLLTQLPTFLRDTLDLKIEKAGFMSALPYLAMSIVLQFAGHLADWLRSKGILTTTQVRKLFNCGAFVAQTVFMLLAAFLMTPVGSIICLTIAVGLGGFAWSGFSVNHLDIAPQYASMLMGISNTYATLPGIISPFLTGIIVRSRSASEWQYVFYISSAIYLLGAIFYGAFASGERQSWAMEYNPPHRNAERPLELTRKDAPRSYVNNALEMEAT